MTTAAIDTVCIIGTGLIGGSLALALKKKKFCKNIIGSGRSEQTLEKATQLGVIDSYDIDIKTAVGNAQLVVIAVPLGAMSAVLAEVSKGVDNNTVVTDVGSVKESVIQDAKNAFTSSMSRFVPGHPIAGTENSGVEAALDTLFTNHRVILTPLDETDKHCLEVVQSMWKAAGAEVEIMSAKHHDLVLAGTSHLPHILAFGLVDCLNKLDDIDEVFRFAAGGFSDFSRIASSDPVMWRDICLANKEQILGILDNYTDQLGEIRNALEKQDGDFLLQLFKDARTARDKFV